VQLKDGAQIILVNGLHEESLKEREGWKPSDFVTGYLGFKMNDESAFQLRSLNKEIQNERLTVLTITGAILSDGIHHYCPFR